MLKSLCRHAAWAPAILALSGFVLGAPDSARADADQPILDFERALRLAIEHNPELQSLHLEVEARDALLLQAGRGPNPSIAAEVDGFAGSGDLSAFNGTEVTLLWEQPFVLGGRIQAQRDVAGSLRALALWDAAQGRVNLLADVHLAFLGVLAGQELVSIQREVLGVTERVLQDVNRRVEAGASSPAELNRARVSFSSSRLEMIRAEAELEKLRQVLAARIGMEVLEYASVEGEIFLSSELPDLGALLNRARNAPLLARYEDEKRVWDAESAHIRARSHGELDLNAGLKHDRSIGEWAVVLQFSMPLQLNNKGAEGAQAATLRAERSVVDSRSVRLRQVEAIKNTFVDLRSSRIELDVLGEEIIPEARRAFDRTEEAYTKGRSSFTDLLDAQRVLFDLSRRRVVVALEHHGAYVRLQALAAENPHDLDLHQEGEQS